MSPYSVNVSRVYMVQLKYLIIKILYFFRQKFTQTETMKKKNKMRQLMGFG